MKKIFVLLLLLLSTVYLFGCINSGSQDRLGKDGPPKDDLQQTDKNDMTAVKDLVETFGGKLQLVSLQAPKDIVSKSIQENYSAYVSPELLEKWLNAPDNAPGRLLSSPWPDRIEIQDIDNLADNTYEVKGEIIEITSVEKVNGGAASKHPVVLVVKKIGDRWLIDAVTFDAHAEGNSIVYKNTQYGFSFLLPDSWKEYQIVDDRWEGLALGGQQGDKIVETGPLLSIRHPQWSPREQRQDIPIMVFTLTQWDSLQREEFHIGAAPILPKELERNSEYVFALPARYNYAFPTGYEEVEEILEGHPLRPN
ncbi:hypothetical protein [Desulfoscipio gibsoniae]